MKEGFAGFTVQRRTGCYGEDDGGAWDKWMMMIYDDGDEGLMKRKMKMMVAWVDLWLL